MNTEEKLDMIDSQLDEFYSDLLQTLTKVFTKIKRYIFYPKKYQIKNQDLELKLRSVLTPIIVKTIQENQLFLKQTKETLEQNMTDEMKEMLNED